jgi:hypothetical protein
VHRDDFASTHPFKFHQGSTFFVQVLFTIGDFHMTTNQNPRDKSTSGTATADTNKSKDERGPQSQDAGSQRAGAPGQHAGSDQHGKNHADNSGRRDGMSDANDPPAGKRPGTTPDQAKPVAGQKAGATDDAADPADGPKREGHDKQTGAGQQAGSNRQ